MKIRVNGAEKTVEERLTLAQLLDVLRLRQPFVAVEVNRELIPREDHAAHELQEGDELEIVTLVGGG